MNEEALLSLSVSSVGKERETIRIAVEMRPMDITLSLALIDRLSRLTKVTEVASLAPATIERMRKLSRRTAQDLNKALLKVVDIKVDWDLPTVLIPMFSDHTGGAVGLDCALGRLRVRSQGSQYLVDCHGFHAGLRRLEKASLAQWKAMDTASTVPVLQKLDLELKVSGVGDSGGKLGVDLHLTQIAIRLEPSLLAGVTGAIANYSFPSLPKRAPSATPPLAMLSKLFSHFAVTLPRVDVIVLIPRYRPGLRVKRPCWGTDFAGDMLPAFGSIKLRQNDIQVRLIDNVLQVRLGQLNIRDEVQCAGQVLFFFCSISFPFRHT